MMMTDAGSSCDSGHGHILLIGGQRCGTTWMQETLASHPLVTPTRVVRPEPKYFLADPDNGDYHALFPDHSDGWLLDKSTTYLERPDAAHRAHACIPNAVVVAVLRNPVERAHSNWRFSVANGVEDRPFADCLDSEAESRPWHGMSTSPYHYLRRGRYAEMLEPWLERFGERVLVLQHEVVVGPAGPRHLADRLGAVGIPAVDGWPPNVPPVNEAPTGERMSGVETAFLREYYRQPNEGLVGLGIDLELW